MNKKPDLLDTFVYGPDADKIKVEWFDIKNKEEYKKITDENKGKKIKIEILRKNKTISKEISVL